jgi:ATP-dependent Lon protease
MVELIIQRYTREAGVRNLERHLAALARAAAVKVAEREQLLRIPKDLQPESNSVLGGGLEGEIVMEVESLGAANREMSTLETIGPLVINESTIETILGVTYYNVVVFMNVL